MSVESINWHAQNTVATLIEMIGIGWLHIPYSDEYPIDVLNMVLD